METKDLVLLMLIPIILVSLVIYTDTNPITGAVAAQQEKKINILGTYSVNPSFKAKADYDLGEYENIRETLNQIVNGCIESENIGECLKIKANDFNWNCIENEETKILYDFIDKFNECLSLENNVVCRFSLDERNIDSMRFWIKLTTEEQKIKAELIKGNDIIEKAYINQENIGYITDYNKGNPIGKSVDAVNIVVGYLAKKPSVIDISAQLDKSSIKLSGIFLLYKTNNQASFIDKTQEGNFRDEKVNKVIDLPRIKSFKFCAKGKKQVYAYSESDKAVKQRDIVYKFAVAYPAAQAQTSQSSQVREIKGELEPALLVRMEDSIFPLRPTSPDYCLVDTFVKNTGETTWAGSDKIRAVLYCKNIANNQIKDVIQNYPLVQDYITDLKPGDRIPIAFGSNAPNNCLESLEDYKVELYSNCEGKGTEEKPCDNFGQQDSSKLPKVLSSINFKCGKN